MWEFVLNNYSWLFSGAGVAAAVLLVRITAQGRLGADKLLRYKRYPGHYEAYQLLEGNYVSKSRVRMVSRRRELRVDVDAALWQLKGSLAIIGSNTYIRYKDLEHGTDSLWVFRDPLSDFEILIGTYAGITKDRQPLAGRVVLVKMAESAYRKTWPTGMRADEMPSYVRQVLNLRERNAILVKDQPTNFLPGAGHAAKGDK